MDIKERFLKYISFNTQSDEANLISPSSKGQLDLASYLVEELHSLNIKNAHVDKFGIVYASIDANSDKITDKIGFISHLDTSPDYSGENIKPCFIKDYDGKIITLNKMLNVTLNPKIFETLQNNIHDDLIVTDGTTLLGADDKAGIAIIMTLIEILMTNSNYKHGQISIAFTPDEEIGRGTNNFDRKKFDADYAYTLDGGDIHYIEYENFNAASAIVNIHGKSIHPGVAKNKMINAILVAEEFNDLLPSEMVPAKTDGYQGFNHIHKIQGNCEEATLEYIIRNHSKTIFNKQKNDFYIAQNILNHKYGYEIIELQIKDDYVNMKEYIEKDPRVLNRITKTYQKLNVNYEFSPIRGGTDGARLSVMGLPTPNLGVGGYNFHGKYEYVSVTQMKKMVEILLELCKEN